MRDNNPGGRPRKYASDAERQAAYCQRWAMASVRLEDRTRQTLETIKAASGADVTISDVVNAAIKFYALNFDWQSGNLLANDCRRSTTRVTARSGSARKPIGNSWSLTNEKP